MNLPVDSLPLAMLDEMEIWADALRFVEPDPAAQQQGERLFARLSSDVIREKFADKTNGVLVLSNQYVQVVQLVRQRKIRQAYASLLQADSETNQLTTTPNEWHFVRSVALPAHAYLCYKLEEYELARHYLLEAMTTDEYLEKQGFTTLHYHRIQQVHNLSRIAFRRDQLAEALQAATELIDYLCGVNGPNLPGRWDTDQIETGSPAMRSAMLCQVVNETVGRFLADAHRRQVKDVIIPLPVFTGLGQLRAATPDEHALKAWYEAFAATSEPQLPSQVWQHTKRLFDMAGQPLEPLKYTLLSYWLGRDDLSRSSLRARLSFLRDSLRPPTGYTQFRSVSAQ